MYHKHLNILIISEDSSFETAVKEALSDDNTGKVVLVAPADWNFAMVTDQNLLIWDVSQQTATELVSEYRKLAKPESAFLVYYDRLGECDEIDFLSLFDDVWVAPITKGRLSFRLKRVQRELYNVSNKEENEAHVKMMKKFQKVLEQDVAVKSRTIADIQQKLYVAFANIIDLRDKQTGAQLRYSSYLVRALLNEMIREGRYPELIDKEYCEAIIKAALVHDIGMFVLPDKVVFKNGSFSEEDREIMRQHTTVGKKMLDRTLAKLENFKEYKVACDMALYHHERFDGNGYPKGLKGKEIPLPARIIAIIDTFAALISPRSYRMTYTIEQAYSLMKSNAGAQFDTEILAAFILARPEVERIVKEMIYKIDTGS